jgi:hypothetical protein
MALLAGKVSLFLKKGYREDYLTTEWGRSRIRTLGTFCTFEKDSLPKASEKCGLIIDLFCHSEKPGYFLERAIAALCPAIANFHAAASTEKVN